MLLILRFTHRYQTGFEIQKMNRLRKYFALLIVLIVTTPGFSQVLIDFHSTWSYFKGTSEPSEPYTHWVKTDFDISGWPVGSAPFSYGYTGQGTQLSDMYGNYSTLYLRNEFEITDPDEIDRIQLAVSFDDGFIIWINGIQVAQKNEPRNPTYDKVATSLHSAEEPEIYTFSAKDLSLKSGINKIALQGFNASKTSTDFYIDARLEVFIKLPETSPAMCNTPSGFYKNLFSVQLTADTPGDTIQYTLDASDPRTSATALKAKSPVNITVYPGSTQGGRGKTGNFVLRASHIKAGYSPSKPITRNYIFVDYVKTQAHPGGNWPTTNVNGQVIDLTMDEKVYNDSRYKNLMEQSLLDIPTIAVNTDPANLFDAQKGIYVNAKYHGYDWERPANIELINPDGTPGFNVDAGIRIRGGWSRHNGYPKHAFRVFFRSEYGAAKLEYPLFGNEGVDEFDKMDLRCSQNYSWANGGSDARHNTMNRDVFSRETQRDMHQPYTRSRYYHLYLNGVYWGIYQTQERAEARFAESYFGGDKDDYDVIKVDIGENWNLYVIEATDGNTDAWEEIWNITQQGFAANINYYKLLGLDFTGEPDTSKRVLLDIDNFVDYMLTIFYTGNFDAPVSKFSGNYNPNNFFAIYNRNNKHEGFKFLNHDAEHTLLTDPAGPGIGLYENRVKIDMNVSSFNKFHPQWLHEKLTDNKEYKVKFADRVYRHFFNNGVFVPDSCIARFRKTADQLDLAVIAESARWGDQGSWQPRNKFDDWVPAVKRVTDDYMPYRTDIVLQQLKDAGLFGDFMPPVFKSGGNEIKDDKMVISSNFALQMQNPNSSGAIVYTTDGSDPRKTGGSKSASAITAGNTVSISVSPGTSVKARILDGSNWSPLHELVFEDSGLFTYMKVTELHYHPLDQGEVNDKELEFIELKNTGTAPIDISGLSFTDGITFTFPEGTVMQPGTFVVIASNGVEFRNFYGFAADFVYSGSLSNGGEKIELKTAAGDIVISFTYSDEDPWPVEADGEGYSLVAVEQNPTGNPDSPDYWTISKNINGSPGKDDEKSTTAIHEITNPVSADFRIYPNPASESVFVDFSLKKEGEVTIGIFDLNGRLLQMPVNEKVEPGNHTRLIDMKRINLPDGIYLISFQTKEFSTTKKLVLRH